MTLWGTYLPSYPGTAITCEWVYYDLITNCHRDSCYYPMMEKRSVDKIYRYLPQYNNIVEKAWKQKKYIYIDNHILRRFM